MFVTDYIHCPQNSWIDRDPTASQEARKGKEARGTDSPLDLDRC